jgi:hypothetical protein
MTDENKEKVIEGEGQKPNSPPQEKPNPAQTPEPQNEKGSPANPSTEFVELQKKHDTLKGQYKGSTEEALRLKEENERLKKENEEMRSKPTAKREADATFSKILEEEGVEAAVEYKLTQTQKRSEAARKATEIYNNFKATHKGLSNPEVLARFDQEFATLKDVYSDVNVALEKAYVLAGGAQAEKPSKVEDTKQKDEETKAVVQNVVGGDEDKRQVPTQTATVDVLQKQINALIYNAAVLSNQGRITEAAKVYVRIDELNAKLKAQLGEKV